MTRQELRDAPVGTRVRSDGNSGTPYAGLSWIKVRSSVGATSHSLREWQREQPGEHGRVIGCESGTLARIGVVICDG